MKKYKFRLGNTEYDKDFKEYRPVFLNDEEIFRIDQTKYCGVKRDQTPEVLEILKQKIGKEITKEMLQRAITFGIIEI
jgi:hypothetical protein